MAAIIVGSGEQEGIYLPLGKKTSVIGRDESLPLQITDERISRRHLQIRYEPSILGYLATDMKSANGTLINGRSVYTETPLKDGDQITIGDTMLLFSETIPTDKANAMALFKNAGERQRATMQ